MARIRKSGLDFVGDIAWGTHMCQFYKTKQDLLEVLVPYFVDGLKDNEFCVWVTSDFLNKEEAIQAMEKAMPNFSSYLQKGQMEIFPYTEWYIKEGKFELQRVLNAWVEKHDKALDSGYVGLRVTGNPFWIDNKKDWDDFAEYEAEINKVIANYKLLVLCTYSLDKCRSDEIIDVIVNHEFGMIKRSGKWALIENSAHKEIEKALRKTETKFLTLYSSMAEGVAFHEIIYDKSGKPIDYVITDINSAFEKITGISQEDAVNKKASELYGTGNAPFLDVYAKVAKTGVPAIFEVYFQPMEKHFSISCVSPSKGKFSTVFHDITVSKKAEEALIEAKNRLQEYTINLEKLVDERTNKLRDSERLAAIGATAGMVGHDIRNPLQAIISDAFLAKMEIEGLSDSEHKKFALESIQEIEKNTEYINKIVQDLQDFARPLNPRVENNDLKAIIEGFLSTNVLPKNIKLFLKIDEGACNVKADSYYLNRIFYNLITNSVQAMPDGGELTISAYKKGVNTVLAVVDTGCGIPKKLKDKIFTLMFTTKAKGQGFGLPVVKRMTESLGGTVTFESEEGKGTKFVIELPSNPN